MSSIATAFSSFAGRPSDRKRSRDTTSISARPAKKSQRTAFDRSACPTKFLVPGISAPLGSQAPASQRPTTSGARFSFSSSSSKAPRKAPRKVAPKSLLAIVTAPPLARPPTEDAFSGIDLEPCFANLDDDGLGGAELPSYLRPASLGCYTYVPTAPRRQLEVVLLPGPNIVYCTGSSSNEETFRMTGTNEPTSVASEATTFAGSKRPASAVGFEDSAASPKRACSADAIDTTEVSHPEEVVPESHVVQNDDEEELPCAQAIPSDSDFEAEQIAEEDSIDLAALMKLIDATAASAPTGRAGASCWAAVREHATKIIYKFYGFSKGSPGVTPGSDEDLVCPLIDIFIKKMSGVFCRAQRAQHELPYEKRMSIGKFGSATAVKDFFSGVNAVGIRGGIILNEASLLDLCTSEDPLQRIAVLARAVRMMTMNTDA